MTSFDPHSHHRRSIRLPDYDYTQPGAYFITVVTRQRLCLFGDIVGGEMILNDIGEIVAETWQWLPTRYPYVQIDAWCVMPNHFHGILVIDDGVCRGGSRPAPTGNAPTDIVHSDIAATGNTLSDIHTDIVKIKPLGQLIGAFKTVSAKHINLARNTPTTPLWQRNYYEHTIRDENDWARIHAYINANPGNWQDDEENR